MKYRAEIDGMRALAVVPVILFHAGFASFSGGYVGVDVFFVISGYLITTILLSEQASGRFTLIDFYERRARRILPALLFVIAVCLPAAWLWMLPEDLKQFADSLVGVALFSSNILFWQESGYFASATEQKPLLHTWSLAVEEQFYLFFPLVLALLSRWVPRRLTVSIAMFALASLAVGHWGAIYRPAAAFYLIPTRAWELMMGSLVATRLFGRDSQPAGSVAFAEWAGTVGVLCIVYSVFAFDNTTRFPGLPALMPTLGTVLVILYASPSTIVGRLLGNRVLVGIGLISYSAYLWHQPLFAFARLRTLEEPSSAQLLTLGGVSIGIAYLSWRYVEQPFRDRKRFSRARIFALAGVGSAALIVLGVIGHLAQGFPGRYEIEQATLDSMSRETLCPQLEWVHARDDWLCDLGDGDQPPSFMVVGDSHARALLAAVDPAASESGMRGVFTGANGCLPLLGIHALREDQDRRNCHLLNERVFEHVRDAAIPTLLLVARWTYYTDGGYGDDDWSYVGLSAGAPRNREHSRAAFVAGLRETVDAYTAIGVRVIVVEQTPQQLYLPERVYYDAFERPQTERLARLRELSVPLARHEQLQAFARTQMNAFGDNPLFSVVSLDDLFCDAERCMIGNATESYYFDDDHVSTIGARRATQTLRRELGTP